MQTDIEITEIDITAQPTAQLTANPPEPANLTTAEYLAALQTLINENNADVTEIEAFLKTHGSEPLKSVEAYHMIQNFVEFKTLFTGDVLYGNKDKLDKFCDNIRSIIKLLCKHGLDPDRRDNETVTPVLFLALGNDPISLTFLTALLESGANPNIIHRHYSNQLDIVREWKPLGRAVVEQDEKAVETLVKFGAEKSNWVLKKDNVEVSGLYLALKSKNEALVKVFLPASNLMKELEHCVYLIPQAEQLRKIDEISADELKELLTEVVPVWKDIMRVWINRNKDPELKILNLFINDPRVIQYLEHRLAIKRYCEGLMKAVGTQSKKEVDEFLSSHENENKFLKSKEASLALVEAIDFDDLGIVTSLLKSGLDPNSSLGRVDNNFGDQHQSNVMFAATRKWSNDKKDIVAALLAHGADPNETLQVYERENSLASPLWHALKTKKDSLRDLLLKAGADPNQKIPCTLEVSIPERRTFRQTMCFKVPPLLAAANEGNEDIVAFLLARPGIDREQTCYLKANYWSIAEDRDADVNMGSRTALMLAAEAGHLKVVSMLVGSGVLVNRVNDKGETALMLAAYADKGEVVAYLLAQGADVTLVSQGKSAYAFASNDDIKAMIEKHYMQTVKMDWSLAIYHARLVDPKSALALDFKVPAICDVNPLLGIAIGEFLGGDPADVLSSLKR